ncbi:MULTISPECIES: hypothetical protein [unclassified Brevundimonas]|uniref:hypothetical protein n=1 Tax=unclassified Brevundimonas TaxID=2622653 RepID=UPI0020046E48|nr:MULTISPECIES: hypothetical protein [unclassified Brevundimonas]MCK6105081.1 hypothetical protein [Brevundimonas sp. EYE_349]
MLKGVGKINGDGWKDATTEGEIVFVWNAGKPTPYAPGQYPRVGNEGWSASTSQYDFTPATANDVPAILALLSARPLALGGQQGVTADSLTQSVTDETMRALLSCKDVGTGRAHLAAIINALSTTPARAEAQDEGAATDDLVDRFAVALKAKLRAAGEKYGFDDAWKADDWRDKLIEDLLRHIQKGDPRDVAAYCAFAWHHDWSLSPKQDDLRSAAFTDRGAEDRYVSQDEGAAGEPMAWGLQFPGKRLRHTFDAERIAQGWADHAGDGAKVVPLYAHPSPPPAADEDRVKIAVEAFNAKINAPLTGPTHGAWDRGRIAGLKEALAALKSTAAKEGGAPQGDAAPEAG